MSWPGFPKRLESALKGLCCLAESGREMQSREIAREIHVSDAETAKVLQLLVWGGFVTSRRGSKGGFRLASTPDRITMGEVIDFFLARQPIGTESKSPVMRALKLSMAPCQEAFSQLTLAEIAKSGASSEKKRGLSRKAETFEVGPATARRISRQ